MNIIYLPVQKRQVPKESRYWWLDGCGTGWLIGTALAVAIFAAFLFIWNSYEPIIT